MSNSRISLIHPTGNPNSREAALALGETGLLYEVITTVAYNPQGSIAQILQKLPRKISNLIEKELSRRTWIFPEGTYISTYPMREILRIILNKTGFRMFNLINWIYASLDSQVAKHHLEGIDAVYGYEDGVADTFDFAKQKGITCFYDLPAVFYRTRYEIESLEAKLFPDLASTLQITQEPSWKIERKEKEVELADHIFVASSNNKKSLLTLGINPDKISVISYGAPIEYFHPQPKVDKCFRTIFVGRQSPQKGVHYLLEAWEDLQLPNAELLFVGSNLFPKGWLDRYGDQFRHVSSVPHLALNQYYSSGSVLVFPSLIEGFGLVLTEAMACGIPIITTENTAGPDIITDGVEGFIIPIRDVEALKEKLEWCYEHPKELAQMGKSARKKAEQLTWELYRQRLANKVSKILTSHQNIKKDGAQK